MSKTSTHNFLTPWLNEDMTIAYRVVGGYFKDLNNVDLGSVTVFAIRIFIQNSEDYQQWSRVITDGIGGPVKFVMAHRYDGQRAEGYNSNKNAYILIPGNGIKFNTGPYLVPNYDVLAQNDLNSAMQLVYE